jgi:mRNA-degrading endonuclease toxin of MazEF toxin-antitoxin module
LPATEKSRKKRTVGLKPQRGNRLPPNPGEMNRGEVWWAEHPDAGRRPFLILTRQAAIGVLARVLAVPATRTIRKIPTEVVLDVDDGMPQRCALSFDNITPMPKSLLTERICRLDIERMSAACRALEAATGC